jgi:rhodanese-related sulfurtransferase
VDLLDGKFNCYDEIMIIDCRFEYEFKGGHVKNAKNMTKKEEIEEIFMKEPLLDKRLCIIFYCEFSSKRGPTGYRNLRDLDRKANEHAYPNLFYPEVYLMEGGYKNFFGSCKV